MFCFKPLFYLQVIIRNAQLHELQYVTLLLQINIKGAIL
jgi:hypothetical protein